MGPETKYSFSQSALTAAEGLLLLDPEGKILLANGATEDLLGFLNPELIGQSLQELLVEFERTGNVKESDGLYLAKNKSGDRIPVALRFGPLLESEGLQMVFLSDISRETERSSRFRTQQIKINALLEAVPDSIFVLDFEGNVLEYYPPTEGQFLPEDRIVKGRNITELFPGHLVARFRQAMESLRRDRRVKQFEFSISGEEPAYYEARLVPKNYHKVLSIVREVTRAKTAQQILDLRNRALETAGNGIVISDALLPDQPIIYSNRAFTEITGYGPDEITGCNCRILQGDDRDQPGIGRIREALEKGEPCREVLRNYRKDGSLFWNDLSITPIKDPKGEVTHFIGVLNDVTQQVAEAEHKDRIRNILESITRDMPLEDIGQEICELLVLQTRSEAAMLSLRSDDGKELLRLSSYNLSTPLMKAFDNTPMKTEACPCAAAAIQKQEIIVRELSRYTAWQKNRKQLARHNLRAGWAFPILSSSQEVLGTCTLFRSQEEEPGKEMRDMIQEAVYLTGMAVERRRTSDRLEESKEQLESYARRLEENVEARTQEVRDKVEELRKTNLSLEEQIKTTKDAESIALASQALFAAIARNFPKGVIMVFDANLHFVHLEGEELERLDLQNWAYLRQHIYNLPGLTDIQKRLLAEQVRETLKGSHLSFEVEHADTIYAVNTTPLEVENSMQWALLVFSNITEEKQAQRDLVRALRTEQELNDLKSRFMSMASHEFRTPLSAILSSAILIGKQNEPGLEVKRERYLRQIKNNVRNLVVILNDFLSLSKLEEGDIGCQASDFDLLELLRSVLEELEASLKVGQHFVEECEMADFNVNLDPKLTRHILVNLLSNAIKYSPENSEIHIRLRMDRDTFTLSVRDQGMGIPEDEQPQLFNRFFRARNAMNLPGTGLGLHIVKKYTELMGGRIGFTSAPGKGSTFKLRLPRIYNARNHEANTDHRR